MKKKKKVFKNGYNGNTVQQVKAGAAHIKLLHMKLLSTQCKIYQQ